MKTRFIAILLLSMSAPLAMAHGDHSHDEGGAPVKPKIVKKSKDAKTEAGAPKAEAEAPKADKADEQTPSAPLGK
jgi:hypothetical protein